MATVPKLRAAFLFLQAKSPDFSEESLPSPSSKSNLIKTTQYTIKLIGSPNIREMSLQEASTHPTRRLLKHTPKPFSNLNTHHAPLERPILHERGDNRQCNRLCEEWCLVFLNRQSNLWTFLPFLPNSFNNEQTNFDATKKTNEKMKKNKRKNEKKQKKKWKKTKEKMKKNKRKKTNWFFFI